VAPARVASRDENVSNTWTSFSRTDAIKDLVIFNAEEGHFPEPFDPADIADIRLSSR
jgi:hypothetical protein